MNSKGNVGVGFEEALSDDAERTIRVKLVRAVAVLPASYQTNQPNNRAPTQHKFCICRADRQRRRRRRYKKLEPPRTFTAGFRRKEGRAPQAGVDAFESTSISTFEPAAPPRPLALAYCGTGCPAAFVSITFSEKTLNCNLQKKESAHVYGHTNTHIKDFSDVPLLRS